MMKNSRFKFRAWNKERNEMYCLHNQSGIKNIELGQYGQINVIELFEYLQDGSFAFVTLNSDEADILQYTGLKDKNGIEIFEGDIVKIKDCYTNGKKTSDMVGEIVFFECEFQVKDKYDNYLSIYRYKDRNEVTGNIYEHSHLLGNN